MSTPPHYDVIIVGAGVTGLQCATTLREDYGITNVLVLEAADYIGGRVKVDESFIPGARVCLGAEIVHGDTNVITELSTKYKWPISQSFTWAHGDGGPSKKEAPDGGAGYYYIGGLKKLVRFNEVPEAMTHLHNVLWGFPEMKDVDLEKYRDMSVRDYLISQGVAEPYLDMACAGFANTAAGTVDNIPMSEAARQARMWEDDGEFDMHLHETTVAIPRHLAKGVNIEINSPVRDITVLNAESGALGSSVMVTVEDGRVYTAEAAVVTVPPPILRDGDISFAPPLAASRLQALRNIYFPNGAKVHLKFSGRAWPADCAGMICSQTFAPEFWFQPFPQADGTTVYMATAFAMDYRADRIAALPEATAIAHCLSQLSEMFGPDVTKYFIGGQVMAWSKQKYVRGGYTCTSFRERPSDRIAIAEPHFERVFFGGEACASAHGESPQTLVGSMQTGIRTARQAARLIQQTKPEFRPVSKL